MLHGVLVALPSPAASPVHSTYLSSARQPAPLRFRVASQCPVHIQVISGFFARPAPLGGRVDVADDGLSSVADVYMLDGHLLLALRAGRRYRSAPIRSYR